MMFDVKMSEKECVVYDQEKPLFEDILIGITTAENQFYDVSLSQFGNPDGIFAVSGENEQAQVQLKLNCDDDSVAFSISAKMKPASPSFNKQPYFASQNAITMKLPLKYNSKFMAIYQHKAWWTRPEFFEGTANIPQKTQLLIWQEGDEFSVMMTLCGKQYRSDLSGDEAGIIINLSSNVGVLNHCDETIAVLCKGSDPYLCCQKASKRLIALSNASIQHRSEKTYPELFKNFGWCSWDAFYHKVSEEGIIAKFDEFLAKEIPVRWALIDDGWSEANYKAQKLIGFDAQKERFPNGLKSAIQKMKSYPQLDYVGVWHATMGYWNGVQEGSPVDIEMAKYLQTTPDGRRIPDSTIGNSFAFWDSWHGYLKGCGVDFVKVDGQSAISIFHEGIKTYGEASRCAQRGLAASAGVHFNANIINCMGMASEDVWNRAGATIARSSDDFVPEVEYGFREHAIQNGYNSLLYGQFYWGDWDMFWSEHPENCQNSILRGVGGGPVYTSDGVGKTDPAYILPLIAKDGKLLKCDEIGVPTVDCLLENPLTTVQPLKLFNSFKDSFMIAAFNINVDNQPSEGRISMEDIPTMQGEYCLYDWKNQSTFILNERSSFKFRVDVNDAALYLCLSIKEEIVPIGLLEKYLSPATIEKVEKVQNRTFIFLSEGGDFGFFSQKEPTHVFVSGQEVSWTKKGDLFVVSCKNNDHPCIIIE